MNREQIKEKMISAMDLPKDVIQNASVITILGRNELWIENYRGIIEYTDTLIRVQTRAGQIRIQGKRLRIQYYTNDEMKVSGTLSSLEFTEGRNPGWFIAWSAICPVMWRFRSKDTPLNDFWISAVITASDSGDWPVSEQIMNYTWVYLIFESFVPMSEKHIQKSY